MSQREKERLLLVESDQEKISSCHLSHLPIVPKAKVARICLEITVDIDGDRDEDSH